MDCRLNDKHINVVLNILTVDMGLVRSQTTVVLSIRCYFTHVLYCACHVRMLGRGTELADHQT